MPIRRILFSNVREFDTRRRPVAGCRSYPCDHPHFVAKRLVSLFFDTVLRDPETDLPRLGRWERRSECNSLSDVVRLSPGFYCNGVSVPRQVLTEVVPVTRTTASWMEQKERTPVLFEVNGFA
jgi:hypothetical protein